MKALVVVAILLGLVGSVLGIISLQKGSDEYEALTLKLRGGKEIRSEAPATHAEKGNQSPSYGAQQAISGDRSGAYTRTCEPIATDDFQCIGALLLNDGVIAFSDTGKNENPAIDADPDTVAAGVAVVTGGARAYAGHAGQSTSTTSRTYTRSTWSCPATGPVWERRSVPWPDPRRGTPCRRGRPAGIWRLETSSRICREGCSYEGSGAN